LKVNATTGQAMLNINIKAPRAITSRDNQTLLVVTGDTVRELDISLQPRLATKQAMTIENLDRPQSVATDSAGNIYVAQGGETQNIAVFDSAGKPLRNIGKPGGRPLDGAYDKTGIVAPGGIAISADGKLWVAETLDSPKRIIAWDTKSGELAHEFFGASQYATFVSIDPMNPAEAFCHGTIWTIDLDNGTWYPKSTMWRSTKPNVVQAGYGRTRVITARNGHQFAWGRANYSNVLYMRTGDVFQPIASGVIVAKGNMFISYPPYEIFADETKYPNGTYVWQDANGDATIQDNEVVKNDAGGEHFLSWLDEDLIIYCESGAKFTPTRIEPDGRPVYDFTKPEPLPVQGNGGFGGMWIDPQDKSIYTIAEDGDSPLRRTSADGKLIWSYNVTGSWRATLNKSIPKPGQVWGITAPLGVAGEVTGVASYFGPFHLFTRDGIYVAKIFKDGRLGETGPEAINAEAFSGQLVKMENSGRYFLLAGDTDGRITELFGLDSIKRFEGSIELSDVEVAAAREAQQAFATRTRMVQQMVVVRGKDSLAGASGVSRTIDSEREFTARLAYDSENLYLDYDVSAPAELVNSIPDPQIIFKGGNLLDLQIVTPQGDTRVLVSRRPDGTPVAVKFVQKDRKAESRPIVLKSPTGQETFDVIESLEDFKLEYTPRAGGFRATAVVPLAWLGLSPRDAERVRLDIGYLFGNVGGNSCGQRAYWSNNSPTSAIIGDIPNESRVEPIHWGSAIVE